MLRFLTRTPGLGVEITSSAVRLVAVSGRGADLSVLSVGSADLPDGLIAESYLSTNICDTSKLAGILRECLAGAPPNISRAALSLPDGVFRVQTIELDELPAKASERERLLRWRLEKTAAYDMSGTVLRYEVLRQRERGYTVLACLAKEAVLAQYTSVLAGLGLETWHIGLSSFNALNLYFPILNKKSTGFALTHLAQDSFATIVSEAGGARFYRYKEVKRGSPVEIRSRFIREIDDSIHFYAHMDRTQTVQLQDLYLTGESTMTSDFAALLGSGTSLNVEVLTPAGIITRVGLQNDTTAMASMAAALGAGSML